MLELLLREATPDQVLKTWTNSHNEWGKGLSLSQYHDRERFLSSYPFAKQGVTSWVLVPASDPTTLNILSACETYARPCVANNEGELVEGKCFSVASVFTPEEHRGMGYARTMMTKVLEAVKAKEGAIASTLYSDVGPLFYAKLGWVVHPSVTARLTIPQSDDALEALLSNLLGPTGTNDGVTTLTIDTAATLLQFDIPHIKAHIASTPSSFAVLPTPECFEWMFARSQFYARHYRNIQQLSVCGVQCPGFNAFVLWAHDFKEGVLTVARFWAASEEGARVLLIAAIKEAKSAGLSEIRLWDPNLEGSLKGVQKHFQVENRSSSLSSLAYFGPGVGERKWLYNENYAWV
ncbi:hypothetical protein HK104_010154 [Borealophlyctis nickersoniae]|nr:hypothetical protein HK104_010154 [Borealophlyctis nickersoniae]